MIGPFEYFEPQTTAEAVSLLCKYGDRAKVLAGGTDLICICWEQRLEPEYVINIGYIPDLDYIRVDDKKGLVIGAATSIRTIEKSQLLRPKYAAIGEAAGQLAMIAIRNVATIGGNLCNAAPSADMSPPLLAMSATIKLVSGNGERVVPLEDFFTGPGATVMKTGELLVEIQVPAPPANSSGTYLKLGARGEGGDSLAVVGVAVVITLGSANGNCEDTKIVLGAVAPTPIRARKAEEILRGKKLSQELIDKAAQAASDESSPITDVRGSAEYRREMLKVITGHAIKRVIG